jgi:hypothetical protein
MAAPAVQPSERPLAAPCTSIPLGDKISLVRVGTQGHTNRRGREIAQATQRHQTETPPTRRSGAEMGWALILAGLIAGFIRAPPSLICG